MTWVVWYIPIIEIQSLLAVYIAQSLAHGIPYMYLTSIYGNAHRSSGSSFSKIIFYSKYKIIFLGLFLLAMFSFNTLILPLVLNYFMVTQAIFVTIFFAVSFSHYALDAHIWKGGVLKQLKGSTLQAVMCIITNSKNLVLDLASGEHWGQNVKEYSYRGSLCLSIY